MTSILSKESQKKAVRFFLFGYMIIYKKNVWELWYYRLCSLFWSQTGKILPISLEYTQIQSNTAYCDFENIKTEIFHHQLASNEKYTIYARKYEYI